jgi:hypothetical protein
VFSHCPSFLVAIFVMQWG